MSRPALDAGSARLDPRGRLIVGIVVAAGVLLRLASYAINRSLWIDEASLALNIASRSYLDLLRPLDYNQAAAPLFLWGERLMVDIAGVNEFALRLVPLLCGLGTVILVYRFANRFLPPLAAALAVAVSALSPALIVYSTEAKPYSLDALVGVGLLTLTFDVLREPGVSRRWVFLLLAGLASILVSTPAPLVLVGLMAALALSKEVWSSVPGRGWLAVSILVLGAATAVVYLSFYREGDSTYLHTVWHDNFLTPGSPKVLSRAWSCLREITWWTFQGGVTSWGVVGLRRVMIDASTLTLSGLAILGLVGFARTHGRSRALVMLAPSAMALVASALQRYPMSLRLVLFVVPPLILMVSNGILRAVEAFPKRRQILVLALVAFALLGRSGTYAVLSLIFGARSEEARTVIRDLESHHRPGEPIYIFSRGLAAWAFYTTDWAAPDTDRLDWFRQHADLDGPAFENAPGRGRPVRADEGHDLVYTYRGRPELLGLSTGVQWLALAGFNQVAPDTGWASREAARIREATPRTAWVFISHPIDQAHEALLAELAARGARVTHRRIEWGAAVLRIEF